MNEEYLSHLVMENLDAVCYISDLETYDLIYLNALGKERVGLKGKDLAGNKCYEILQGKTQPCSFCTNDRLVKGESYKWEFSNPIMNRDYNLVDTIINWKGRDVRLEFAFDVTEEKAKLTKLATQLTFEETLLKCAQALSGHKDMKEAIYKLLGIIGQFFGGDRSYIFEICEDPLYMNNTYEWNGEGVTPQIDNLQMVPVEVVDLWFERFKNEGEFFITSLESDVDTNSDTYKILEPQGIESLMAAPLIIDNKYIGFLGVDNPTVNTRDTALLRGVTLFVTSELEKKEINDKLEESSFIDSFTGIYNRNKYIKVIESIVSSSVESVGILYLDIDGLKKANDEYGHEYGDRMILKLTDLLRQYFSYELFRIGGDEFIGLYFGNKKEEFEKAINIFKKVIREQKDISVALGSVWCTDTTQIVEAIAEADALMYANKQDYYKEKALKNEKVKDNKLIENNDENKLNYYQTDLLTGCLNKESTATTIESIIDNSTELNDHVFMLVDLSHFGTVNKFLGHADGDKILRKIGTHLRNLIRPEDILGRISGDSFIIFIKNISSILAIKQKAEEILFVMGKDLSSHHKDVFAFASIGISRFKQDGFSYAELYKNAYSALCVAKFRGRGKYSIFSWKFTKEQRETENSREVGHIIFGKNTNNDIILKTFKLLQEAEDIPTTINQVLETIGKKFDVSRAFVFELNEEKQHYSNTYEWCAEGIISEIDTLQNIPKDTYLYMTSFGKETGTFVCNTMSEIDGEYKELLEAQGVKSFLQSFAKIKGVPQLLIGLQDCVQTRIWT